MALDVIGLGFGRTATNSMKMALEQLGFLKCHHMYEVMDNKETQAPLWHAALQGKPDWTAIYDGYRAALDWPTAGFAEELYGAFPNAKFVLTTRSAESWYESISTTILEVIKGDSATSPGGKATDGVAPPAVKRSVGEEDTWSRENLIRIFNDHEQLLVFSPKQGWEPLCAFLGVPAPSGDFPRSNDEEEFFERLE